MQNKNSFSQIKKFLFSNSVKKKFNLELCSTWLCGRMCDYCPQTDFLKAGKKMFPKKRYKFLSIDLFKKIIKNINPDTTIIQWTGFTEPLDTPDFGSINKILLEKKFDISISTTLIGKEKSKIWFLENIDKFKKITLHLPDNEKIMKGDFNNEYEEFFSKCLKKIIQKKMINITTLFLIGDNFHEKIKETIFKFKKNHNLNIITADNLNTRNSSIDVKKFGYQITSNGSTKEKDNNIISDHNFYCAYKRLNCNIVLPDGTVVLCCNDYKLKNVIGNLESEKLETIVDKFIIEHGSSFIEGSYKGCLQCEHYSPFIKGS